MKKLKIIKILKLGKISNSLNLSPIKNELVKRTARKILDDAIFINANLFRTYFRYASLVKTDFLFASMVRLNFEGADLRNATINGAYLADVSFMGANLLNTDMFRLWDVDISDEQYEDFKKRGARI